MEAAANMTLSQHDDGRARLEAVLMDNDSVAHENSLLRDRIRNLEAELRWACDINVVAVEALQTMLEREKKQRATIRQLMGLPAADPYDHADDYEFYWPVATSTRVTRERAA
jgi:hypothetical protein